MRRRSRRLPLRAARRLLSYNVAPALSAGLSMSSATGMISGTPTVTGVAGSYTVTVKGYDSATASARLQPDGRQRGGGDTAGASTVRTENPPEPVICVNAAACIAKYENKIPERSGAARQRSLHLRVS